MKRILTAVFILLISLSVCYGQESDSLKFGHITQSEIELKQNPRYKDASAVVLQDLGNSRIVVNDDGSGDVNFSIVFHRDTRIKIFTDAGIRYATVEIPFQVGYRMKESVSHIKAVTYNYKNGKLIADSLAPENIYYVNKNGIIHVAKFVLPNVRKGSIIEYSYNLKTNSLLQMPSWHFQRRIPVLYSHYEVRALPFFQYITLMQGVKKLDVNKPYVDYSHPTSHLGVMYNDIVRGFSMRNVPAFKDEQYVPSVEDYLIKVEFQLSKVWMPGNRPMNYLKTWSDLVKDRLLKGDFGRYFGQYVNKSSRFSLKELHMKDIQNKPEQARFNFIMDYAKNHFTWNGRSNWFAYQTPEQLISSGTGSSQDINLFTVGMLRAAGLKAYPVLISTREHGTIKYNYPYLNFFNDVIIMTNVDGKLVLSDASSPNSSNDQLPIRCINGKGLVVRKKFGWVPLEHANLSQVITVTKIQIQHDTLKAAIAKLATGYDALRFRNMNLDKSGKLRKRLELSHNSLVDSSVSIQNQRKRNKPYILKYSFYTRPVVIGNIIYVSPFFGQIGVKNMFTQNKRTFPVDMAYPDKKEYTTQLTIPAGYKLDFVPNPLEIDNDLYQLNYRVMYSGNLLTITLEYYFKKSTYPASDYLKLKSFYAKVIKKAHEKIVLTKSNGNS